MAALSSQKRLISVVFADLAQDIAAGEHVDVRTVYNDMNEAISALTPRIFGIDGLKPTDVSKSLH